MCIKFKFLCVYKISLVIKAFDLKHLFNTFIAIYPEPI